MLNLRDGLLFNLAENEEGRDERRQLPFAEDPKNAGLPPGAETNVYYFIDSK